MRVLTSHNGFDMQLHAIPARAADAEYRTKLPSSSSYVSLNYFLIVSYIGK